MKATKNRTVCKFKSRCELAQFIGCNRKTKDCSIAQAFRRIDSKSPVK